jgi:simple sugar transport system ATP-binding protein
MTADHAPAIELRSINKHFGPVHANRNVSLTVAHGSITGIIGENGAGKSTLMSILYGLYEADSGEILVGGKPVVMRNPRDALKSGVGMVHQHFMLVDTFTVLENVVLGAESGPLLRQSLGPARAEVKRLGREYSLNVDPDALVGNLPVGEQQRVEIVKVLYRGARILILDEPSAVLTPQETDQLFDILRTLRDRGVTVILITHKLREIMAVTDQVYVMRHGEIVGIAGVSGNGQSELLAVLAGIRPPTTGRLTVGARQITATTPADPAEMRELGLAHVPEDRLRYALVGAFAADESSVLGYHKDPPFSGPILLDHAAISNHCATLMERFDVRPRRPTLNSANFSGGNQQKLVLAREFAPAPRILLVGQPTRGVDIGAIEFIHRQLVAIRDAGCAVLVVSVELDEVMSLADRILVMCGGRIVGEVAGAQADERTLGRMMANIWTAPDETGAARAPS